MLPPADLYHVISGILPFSRRAPANHPKFGDEKLLERYSYHWFRNQHFQAEVEAALWYLDPGWWEGKWELVEEWISCCGSLDGMSTVWSATSGGLGSKRYVPLSPDDFTGLKCHCLSGSNTIYQRNHGYLYSQICQLDSNFGNWKKYYYYSIISY